MCLADHQQAPPGYRISFTLTVLLAEGVGTPALDGHGCGTLHRAEEALDAEGMKPMLHAGVT